MAGATAATPKISSAKLKEFAGRVAAVADALERLDNPAQYAQQRVSLGATLIGIQGELEKAAGK